jgi:6-phosphofructokinase 1
MTGDFGRMVCYRNGEVTSCPMDMVIGRTSYVDVEKHYDIERYSGRRTIFRHSK